MVRVKSQRIGILLSYNRASDPLEAPGSVTDGCIHSHTDLGPSKRLARKDAEPHFATITGHHAASGSAQESLNLSHPIRSYPSSDHLPEAAYTTMAVFP